MLAESTQDGLSEKVCPVKFTRETLDKFQRSKILEVYFTRLEGRFPESIPAEHSSLYDLDLNHIKGYLLGQHPQDPLLQKLFRIMS
jgi:hypothetical protein